MFSQPLGVTLVVDYICVWSMFMEIFLGVSPFGLKRQPRCSVCVGT